MQLPFFGYHLFVEILISAATAFFGFSLFPRLLVKARDWFEDTIYKVVTDIVTSFWDQQSKKIQEARREKQKKKSEEEQDKQKKQLDNAVLLDTSVLIDGRVLDLVKTGFFDEPMVLLQAVLDELQLVADSKDKLKRQRGRRGLDIAKDLRRNAKVALIDLKKNGKEVDGMLASYAKENKLKLMTMDFNLNKMASATGVKVLNMNDLVNSLKTVMLPGEPITLQIVQEGKEKEQGIGYLPDGTMIVVEGAKSFVGQEVGATVSKVIQSSAGRIIFSKIIPTAKVNEEVVKEN